MYNADSACWENVTFDALLSLIKNNFKFNEKNFEQADGVLNLLGFNEAEVGSQLIKNESGQISWVKPDVTVIEGLNAIIETLQNTSNDHETRITNLEDIIPNLNSSISALESDNALIKSNLDQKANILDVYTKIEVENKISEAIISANHLKRIIVDSINNIDIYAENALQYIYMIANGLEEDDNKYYEYIVIEADNGLRTIERVGSWAVDLSDYATKEEVSKKADVSTVTDLIQSIDSIQSTISSHDAEIVSIKNILDTKANQSTVDDISSSLTALTEEITKNASAIENITKSLNADYVSKTEITSIQEEIETLKQALTWQSYN